MLIMLREFIIVPSIKKKSFKQTFYPVPPDHPPSSIFNGDTVGSLRKIVRCIPVKKKPTAYFKSK